MKGEDIWNLLSPRPDFSYSSVGVSEDKIRDDAVVYRPAKVGKKSSTLVIILGWSGATRRQIQKLLIWYKDALGVDTISFLCPMFGYDNYNDYFVTHLEKYISLDQRERVVFHIFSQNGTFTFCTLLQSFQQQLLDGLSNKDKRKTTIDIPQFFRKLDHVVFDSCPVVGPLPDLLESARLYSRALVAMRLGRGQYEHTLLSPLYKSYLTLQGYLTKFHVLLWKRLDNLSLLLPSTKMLFLYSTKDELCPSDIITSFIEEKKRNGHVVQSILWRDSPHVGHLIKHGKEYLSKVKDFIQDENRMQEHQLKSNL